MPERDAPFDVTGTVPLDDAIAAADAVEAILARAYGPHRFDRDLLRSSFAFVDRLYAGGQPGWLACDMPYHDLRHALDAALATARLVDGCRRESCDEALAPDLGLVAVLLALLHDTGLLRTAGEASLCGPQLAPGHEFRSSAFAADYLRSTSLARHAGLAPLILTTRVATSPAELLDVHHGSAVTIGRMLGSADLVCQMADPRYIERCYHHLYPEMVLGGGAGARGPDGRPRFVAEDARDVLARTPGFCESIALPRLRDGLGCVARHLAAHFGGSDPYAASIRANLERCGRIVAERRWDLVGPAPPTTTSVLDPIYLAGASASRIH
jgi:hypothetical protein